MSLRRVAISLTALALLGAGCSRIEGTAEYQAVCHGPPLRNVAEHEQAQVDGYSVDFRYRCITKDSYAAIEKQKALWEAANTPEAKAKREAELAAQHALYMAEQERKAAEQQRKE